MVRSTILALALASAAAFAPAPSALPSLCRGSTVPALSMRLGGGSRGGVSRKGGFMGGRSSWKKGIVPRVPGGGAGGVAGGGGGGIIRNAAEGASPPRGRAAGERSGGLVGPFARARARRESPLSIIHS